VITKKRMAEEVKLNKGLEKYAVLRKDFTHMTHDVCDLLSLPWGIWVGRDLN